MSLGLLDLSHWIFTVFSESSKKILDSKSEPLVGVINMTEEGYNK